jgi:hypothetical protein
MGFFDEISSAATTATTQVRKVVSDIGAASGISSLASSADSVLKSAASGLTNVGSLVPGAPAGVLSGAQQALSALKDLDLLKALDAFKNKVSVPGEPPFPNILHNYSTYNYVFTLSVLDDVSLNFPDETYKQGQYGPLILRSAGGAPTSDLVPTAYGKYDFFLDNVKISSSVGLEKSTGNTNATGVSFKITEPYSMGLFFQSVQTAALVAGHQNYLDIPLLLTIEFKGHVDAALQNVQIDKTTKHIPLKLREIGMRVTGKGCEYDVEAYPWNEQGFSTSYSQLKTDVNISGSSVQDMLQTGEKSLQKVLNDKLQQEVKRKDVNVADQIIILFPTDLASSASPATNTESESDDKSATVNPGDAESASVYQKLGVGRGKNSTLVQGTDASQVNPIGLASMGFNLYRKGDTPFAKDNVSYDEKTGTYKRGNITIDPSKSDFKFNQGVSVVNVINQVILMSDYGRNALKEAQLTPEGQVVWWRVETQVFNTPTEENLKKTGLKPKIVVYRVVPYLVDASIFLPPNAPKPGLENAKKQSLKEYNYIYTGKNLDILDFSIEFKAGFYRALHADSGDNNEGKELEKKTGAAATSGETANQEPPEGQSPDTQQTPSVVRKDKIESSNYSLGGGGYDDAASIAARQFHDLATNGVDMINLNLTILGDPYYIATSGMGNYSATATNFQNMTSDGEVDYQSGEVYITVNFRTPIDINQQTGFYNFGDTRPVQQFSGLFRVLQIESIFNKGTFKQTLSLVRIPGQDNPDAEAQPTFAAPVEAPAGFGVAYDDEGNLMPGWKINDETGDTYWSDI